MNVHHLELFYFVARFGGISEAVRNMPYGIQQPAVSSQIIQLEEFLGVTLFQRRPFELTPAGDELYQFAAPFFGNLARMTEKLQALETFDAAQQEYLLRDAAKLPEGPERDRKHEEVLHLFNLWPLTARVVCIAMLNAESGRGQVLFTADDYEEDAGTEAGPVEFVACMDEAEMLTAFWDVARHYDGIVTFNGRGFDVPFLYLRSAVLNVPISRKDWLGYRFAHEPHCDLADQFTFYSGGRDGAGRRFNLDFYCKAFGLESPKSHGVTGMDVNTLMAEGRYRDIAEYCLRDVEATVRLYQIWRERLAGFK